METYIICVRDDSTGIIRNDRIILDKPFFLFLCGRFCEWTAWVEETAGNGTDLGTGVCDYYRTRINKYFIVKMMMINLLIRSFDEIPYFVEDMASAVTPVV